MLDRRTFLVATPGALALLADAGRPARAAGSTGKALSVGTLAQDIGPLDPHRAVGTPERIAVSWMFNGLVRFKPGSSSPALLEPDLAASWEASPDKRLWTFHLRRGVQFHGDYGELTADDVVFSLKRAAAPASSAFSSDFGALRTIAAVDPYTVRIELDHAVPSLLGTLSDYAGGFIVCKKAVEKLGDNFTRAPIGTGPFAFVRIAPNELLELAGHAGYFRGQPKLGTILYRFLAAASSRDLAYESGEIDLVYGVQDQRWVTRYKQIAGTTVDLIGPGDFSQIYLNTKAGALADIRVRQAIAHAIDRAELMRWRGADVCRECTGVMPSVDLGFTKDTGLQQFDPAKAKQLLAAAGYPQGLTIKVVQTQLSDMLGLMQVVQAQLERAGIRLDFQMVEHSTWHQMIRQDLSPMVMYSASRFPVADVYLTQFFSSRSIVNTPTAVTNFSHCNVADAEIDAARTEPDAAKQLELWATAQRKIVAEVCAVPLIESLNVWAHRNSFAYGFDLEGAMSGGPPLTEQSGFV
jgi:peptide/nickel transport system substrate-binding protein